MNEENIRYFFTMVQFEMYYQQVIQCSVELCLIVRFEQGKQPVDGATLLDDKKELYYSAGGKQARNPRICKNFLECALSNQESLNKMVNQKFVQNRFPK